MIEKAETKMRQALTAKGISHAGLERNEVFTTFLQLQDGESQALYEVIFVFA